jgi:hypothetical protein
MAKFFLEKTYSMFDVLMLSMFASFVLNVEMDIIPLTFVMLSGIVLIGLVSIGVQYAFLKEENAPDQLKQEPKKDIGVEQDERVFARIAARYPARKEAKTNATIQSKE